jgi:hypothetical protein
MNDASSQTVKDSLLTRLSRFDDESRDRRADRIIWLAQFTAPESRLYSRIEPMLALNEARACYVNAHHVAVVLLATAYIEHTIAGAIQTKTGSYIKMMLGAAIDKARQLNLFSPDLLDDAKRLSEVRNPASHMRDGDHESTIQVRSNADNCSPFTILENDAKMSIKIMYAFYEHDA